MSLSHTIKSNCSYCNSEQDFRYYETVNITLQPELKNKVLSGKLNTNICSNCKKETDIVSGFLYHDMKNQLMLEMSVSDEDNDEGKKDVINNFVNQGYIYRKVNEYGRLIEKIEIFDNKLNDLVVQQISEKLKAMLEDSIRNVKDSDEDFSFNVVFKKLENGLFKKKIAFYCFTTPEQLMEIKYDIKNLTPEEKKDLYNLKILRK